MAFKSVTELSADETISLGGHNKKTGKANPTRVEGYYLGSKTVDDKKKKSGVSHIYFFQTPKGNIGVWGKTDLDRKMAQVSPGMMTRATQSGMRPTPNGDMYLYQVEVDNENTIEVAAPQAASSVVSNKGEDSYDAPMSYVDEEETDLDDDSNLDEIVPVRVSAPRTPARTIDPAKQAKVQELLSRGRNK